MGQIIDMNVDKLELDFLLYEYLTSTFTIQEYVSIMSIIREEVRSKKVQKILEGMNWEIK